MARIASEQVPLLQNAKHDEHHTHVEHVLAEESPAYHALRAAGLLITEFRRSGLPS